MSLTPRHKLHGLVCSLSFGTLVGCQHPWNSTTVLPPAPPPPILPAEPEAQTPTSDEIATALASLFASKSQPPYDAAQPANYGAAIVYKYVDDEQRTRWAIEPVAGAETTRINIDKEIFNHAVDRTALFSASISWLSNLAGNLKEDQKYWIKVKDDYILGGPAVHKLSQAIDDWRKRQEGILVRQAYYCQTIHFMTMEYQRVQFGGPTVGGTIGPVMVDNKLYNAIESRMVKSLAFVDLAPIPLPSSGLRTLAQPEVVSPDRPIRYVLSWPPNSHR